MSGSDKVITAYPNYAPQKFDQSLPGKDQSMEPLAEHTKVERWHRGEPRLEEYVGNGKLKGKVALITGADSGIGRTVAAFFAREGAAGITVNYLPEEEEECVVVLLSSIRVSQQLNKDGGDSAQVTKKLIEDAGQKALLVPGDLRSQTFREKLVNEHIKAFGHLDILVNNASQQLQCKDLAEIDMDKVNDTFQTNIIQYIGVANKGSAGMVDYSATKGAIATFTRSLAQQLMPKAIRVCAVAPGPVYTPLQPASRSPDQMEDWGVESVPLHGRVAQPAELGESYVYLATSNLSTGTIVHPNSGQFFVP
ncbi:SPOSA6832_02306 [Sporobolomyces salmonicolor]|uniref:SPOSA6832_02306-mRNA-1:cds n=1 Tax=Sporidiobolus salmonicolor TaxID=5005 RepID=A0A0D6EKY6_SPOSA|nr:SPOSA6832_02306 [Sporobolomyces salmonicolor]